MLQDTINFTIIDEIIEIVYIYALIVDFLIKRKRTASFLIVFTDYV